MLLQKTCIISAYLCVSIVYRKFPEKSLQVACCCSRHPNKTRKRKKRSYPLFLLTGKRKEVSGKPAPGTITHNKDRSPTLRRPSSPVCRRGVRGSGGQPGPALSLHRQDRGHSPETLRALKVQALVYAPCGSDGAAACPGASAFPAGPEPSVYSAVLLPYASGEIIRDWFLKIPCTPRNRGKFFPGSLYPRLPV